MQIVRLWEPGMVADLVSRDPKTVCGTEDGSALLGPGVYVLWNRGRVVHVDWAKNVLDRVAVHRQLCGERIPSWLPIQGIRFDRFTWKPCPEHKSAATLTELKETLGVELARS